MLLMRMTEPDLYYEKMLWERGLERVAGLDEVGRGSFAGPVVAGAVVFDKSINIGLTVNRFGEKVVIRDSKRMTVKQRGIAADWIAKHALEYGIGEVSVDDINSKGIITATSSAFRRAAKNLNNKLKTRVEYLLVDAFFVPSIRGYPVGSVKDNMGQAQAAIPKGDSISFSIAAASIIAKVYRDELMKELSRSDKRYKKYAWHSNKGYGTKWHRNAIREHGICEHHRKQFVSKLLNN